MHRHPLPAQPRQFAIPVAQQACLQSTSVDPTHHLLHQLPIYIVGSGSEAGALGCPAISIPGQEDPADADDVAADLDVPEGVPEEGEAEEETECADDTAFFAVG
jgi:hypothetical protein